VILLQVPSPWVFGDMTFLRSQVCGRSLPSRDDDMPFDFALGKQEGRERLAHCVCCSLGFVVWLVPPLAGDAVAAAAIEILLGPMYPIAMNHAERMLPRWFITA